MYLEECFKSQLADKLLQISMQKDLNATRKLRHCFHIGRIRESEAPRFNSGERGDRKLCRKVPVVFQFALNIYGDYRLQVSQKNSFLMI